MSTPEIPTKKQSKRAAVPWGIGLVVALLVWGVGPWAISLLTPRYGWAAGRPGLWNLLGLIPVVAGTTGLIWTMVLHAAQSPEGVDMELAKSYLLRHGPYAFSRHPMYLSELTLLLGWVAFYGSVAVLITFVAAGAMFHFIAVPIEERALEARFGEAYLEYKNKVPRWLGMARP